MNALHACVMNCKIFSRWAISSALFQEMSLKADKYKKLNFVVSFVSYLVISPIAWDELDTCQALMDFLFRRHQTSFILSSFQTFLLKSSIKVECVQGTVKDLNWNARRQTQQSGEMVRDSQIRTSSYWPLKQKLPSDASILNFSPQRETKLVAVYLDENIYCERAL